MLALAAALVMSQVVYSWVDEQGVTHYTDGASGIPENAEKSELEPAPVTVIPRAPENLPRPEPLPPAPEKKAAAPSAPDVKPAEHSTHNPLPGFQYVENPEGMEGTGLYYRFDPHPYPYAAPCPPHLKHQQRVQPQQPQQPLVTVQEPPKKPRPASKPSKGTAFSVR